jgi:hypothetical protein
VGKADEILGVTHSYFRVIDLNLYSWKAGEISANPAKSAIVTDR